MPFRKAIDDLREVTLAVLPGRWLKLLYFAKLRRSNEKKYSHWGFEEKFGASAEPALREAHRTAYQDVLRAAIPELVKDCEEYQLTAEALDEDAVELMRPLPADGHSDAHLRYVLASVRACLRAKKRHP